MNAQTPNVPAVIQAVEKRIAAFAAVLPPQIPAARFVASFKTTALVNPDILRANPRSVVLACMQAANDGLLPDGKDAAIVIRKGVASYQRMVGGLIKLLYRSGKVSSVHVDVVRQGDDWDYSSGDEPFIHHKPSLRVSGEIVAAYSVLTMKDGTKSRCLMGWEEIERIMRMSPQGWDSQAKAPKGIWAKHPAEMAKKTVLHRHVKLAPLENMPETLADDDVAEIEDAAWSEPEDHGWQEPGQPDGSGAIIDHEPLSEGATSRIEENPPLYDQFWRVQLDALREQLSLTMTVADCEEAYNAWDAEHTDVPEEVMNEVSKITADHVARIKALQTPKNPPRKGQTAGDYEKAKNG